MKVEFNINDYVYVKLNDLGYQHLADLHRDLYVNIGIEDPEPEMSTKEYYENKATKDGYTSMQMWVFMSEFGSRSSIGFKQMYSTNILFNIKDLTSLNHMKG